MGAGRMSKAVGKVRKVGGAAPIETPPPGGPEAAATQSASAVGSVTRSSAPTDHVDKAPQPRCQVFYHDDPTLAEIRALLARSPTSLRTDQAHHVHATAYARTVPDVVRLTTTPGVSGTLARSVYELEWLAGAGQVPMLQMALDCWRRFSVGMALDAKKAQSPDLIYPGMPLLIYGRLRSASRAPDVPRVHLYDEERSTRKIALGGIGDPGGDWTPNLRKQRVFALGIVDQLNPLSIRVAVLTF